MGGGRYLEVRVGVGVTARCIEEFARSVRSIVQTAMVMLVFRPFLIEAGKLCSQNLFSDRFVPIGSTLSLWPMPYGCAPGCNIGHMISNFVIS